jgi:hypothetical protein
MLHFFTVGACKQAHCFFALPPLNPYFLSGAFEAQHQISQGLHAHTQACTPLSLFPSVFPRSQPPPPPSLLFLRIGLTLEAMRRPSHALPHFYRAIAARGKFGYAPSALRIFRILTDEATPSSPSNYLPPHPPPPYPSCSSVTMGRGSCSPRVFPGEWRGEHGGDVSLDASEAAAVAS